MKSKLSVIGVLARTVLTGNSGQIAVDDSAVFTAISYHWRQRALVAEFKNGRDYEYGCVPLSTFARFLAADSKGSFFSKELRDRVPYMRLKHEEQQAQELATA